MKKKKTKKILLILLIIVLILIGILVLIMPRIELKGKSEVVVNVYGKYKDKGYEVSFLGKDLSRHVKVKGTVNTKKVGTYELKYIFNYKGIIKEKRVRTIKVVDSEKPIITLDGNSTICFNQTYKEEGFKAIDNYDGDITEKVKTKDYPDHIEYTVSDSSNNLEKVIRTLIINQSDPKISLKSASTINVYQYDKYIEPGYTITDKCTDGSGFKVTVTGSVDTAKIGNYTLKYTVDGTSESTQRTVRVIQRPVYRSNVIYLTFDDGPSNVTNQILDVLKEENVKATFFVIDNGRGLDYIIKRAHNEGHTVALHSGSHDYNYIYASETNYFNDLANISNIVKNLTGKDSKVIRFPGGASNMVSRFNPGIMTRLTNEVVNRGYSYFDWNVDSNDAGGAWSSDEIYRNVVNNLNPSRSNVVLMHDAASKQATANALRNIIQYGKNNGYNFDRLTETTAPVRHGVNN